MAPPAPVTTTLLGWSDPVAIALEATGTKVFLSDLKDLDNISLSELFDESNK